MDRIFTIITLQTVQSTATVMVHNLWTIQCVLNVYLVYICIDDRYLRVCSDTNNSHIVVIVQSPILLKMATIFLQYRYHHRTTFYI